MHLYIRKKLVIYTEQEKLSKGWNMNIEKIDEDIVKVIAKIYSLNKE